MYLLSVFAIWKINSLSLSQQQMQTLPKRTDTIRAVKTTLNCIPRYTRFLNFTMVCSGEASADMITCILYDHYLPTVILICIQSPTHSFTLGLNPSFSANPLYRGLSFFSFRIHYMDFPDCLLLLLSISVFLLFSFFPCF